MLRARHSRNSYYLVGAGYTKEDGVVVQYQSDNTTEHMMHGQPQLCTFTCQTNRVVLCETHLLWNHDGHQ